MKNYLFALAALVMALMGVSTFPAVAADVAPASSQFKLPQLVTSGVCTASQCSGFYVGLGLSGDGTNASLAPGGLNGSVFAGGAIVDGHAGYQYWNGTYLFAFEAGIGNQFSNGPVSAWGSQTLYSYEGVKLGGALSGLLGTSPAQTGSVAGQAPGTVPVFSSLANAVIAPYVWLGAVQRGGINQGTVGMGIEYVIAQSWNLDTRYTYSPSSGALGTMQQITVGLNYHFGVK